ncbi:hypothetical protein FOZ63_010207 [Perkinsus olseni]|uniref:Uncharacterized protein n=1 Tax=Perkinsus olseni TaxID=32597 RepID=A0A7J6S3Y2_PEROL|nr:hypothetical protein FOZ63_010207 [Perkinsus olseni]
MGLRSKRRALPKKKFSSATVTLKAPAGLAVEAEHEEPEGAISPEQDQSVVQASVEDTAEGTTRSNSRPIWISAFFWHRNTFRAEVEGRAQVLLDGPRGPGNSSRVEGSR